jgi:hypothetical protein
VQAPSSQACRGVDVRSWAWSRVNYITERMFPSSMDNEWADVWSSKKEVSRLYMYKSARANGHNSAVR